MEAQGVVRRLEGDEAVVEVTEEQGGCGRCHEPGGCKTGLLSHGFRHSCREFRVHNGIGAQPGEQVVLRVAEGSLLQAAFIAYLLPVASVLLGAGAGVAFAGGGATDMAALFGALAGLGLGAWGAQRLQRARARQAGLLPVMARRH